MSIADAARLFLLFFSYAVLGWCMEVSAKFVQFRRFINRGFLIGPYCPIYGVGALMITLLLKRYAGDPPALFAMGMIVCSVLEYFTSWAMEKLFHARWWDYSTKRFNINGRICLNTMVPFGLLGVVIMEVVNPLLYRLFGLLSETALMIVSAALAAGFIVDLCVSGVVMAHVRHDNRVLDRDNTEEMSAKVRQAIAARGWMHRRLLDAFPHVRHIGKALREGAEATREAIEQSAEATREKIEEGKARTREAIEEGRTRTREAIAQNKARTREFLEEGAAQSRARLEAELAKLEQANARREAEFNARRRELEDRLNSLKETAARRNGKP